MAGAHLNLGRDVLERSCDEEAPRLGRHLCLFGSMRHRRRHGPETRRRRSCRPRASGKASGPLFCAGLRRAFRQLRARVPGIRAVAYREDRYLIGTLDEVGLALWVAHELWGEVGLRINDAKLKLFTHDVGVCTGGGAFRVSRRFRGLARHPRPAARSASRRGRRRDCRRWRQRPATALDTREAGHLENDLGWSFAGSPGTSPNSARRVAWKSAPKWARKARLRTKFGATDAHSFVRTSTGRPRPKIDLLTAKAPVERNFATLFPDFRPLLGCPLLRGANTKP